MLPITASNPFKWRHYPGDIIMWCVRWYLRYPISFTHMAEMAVERGLAIDASCIWRWVQIYGPELDKRCRRHLKPTNRSWRLDETYINVKGRDRFLYRAVDSSGQTIDFLLTDRRDAAAAKRFFRRALQNEGNAMPRVINVDRNLEVPDSALRMGPLSTVVGAAIVHAIQIEAAALLVERGEAPPVLASANLDTTSQDDLERTLARYAGRIRYLDVRRKNH